MIRGDLLRKAVISEAVHVNDEVLPAGWRWVRLGDIADLRHGVNFRKHEINTQATKDVRILRGGNVLDDKLVIFKDDLFLPSANVKAVDYLQEQDIITPSVTSLVNVGKVAFIDYPIESTACGAFMYRVRAKSDEVLPKYLYFAMSSNFVKYQMKRMTHKSVVAFYNVTMKNFRTVLIPLPPIDEQRRIVAYLDPLVRELTELEEHLTKFRAARERFRKAAIQDATHTREGEELPAGWRWVKFKDIARVVSARRVHKRDWQKEGVPFYRARDIVQLSQNRELQDKLFITEELYSRLSKFALPEENDIMITAVGTLGKTYVVKKEDRFYYKDASVLCLKLSHEVSAQYVHYVLQSEFMRRQIFSNAHGTTVLTLPIRHMENYSLPLPPIDQQRQIVNYLDNLSHQINHMDL